MRGAGRLASLLPLLLFGCWFVAWQAVAPSLTEVNVLAAEAVPARSLVDPDKACAACHQSIYDRYERTAKAMGSGIATDELEPGALHDQTSRVDYRVFLRDGSAWMSYRRASSGHDNLEGERRLEYFIGSGRHGRTYLYQQDGEWFELPINYYTHRKAWGMAPAYDGLSSMPGPLPTNPNCLHCHASQVQTPLETASNRFATVPFKQAGIGCSGCHGDATAHLATQGHGPILNPSHLAPARRDSVCTQCHLEGDAVVYRPGRSLAEFRVGDDLTQTAVYFVRASQQAGGARATSQFEGMLRSACKRASGDRLTCTSCHDPHESPAASERVVYYRSRCLACHQGKAMATEHHPEQPDCASCHMPKRDTTDISHEQVSDHDIERVPQPAQSPHRSAGEDLVPVGGVEAGDREYGLAYAQMAARGDQGAQQKALRLLERAEKQGASDAEFEVRLGYLRQLAGQTNDARGAYEKALKLNAFEPTGLANLAVLYASLGRTAEAVQLLDRLVVDDPSKTAPGMNLAFILCKLGHGRQTLGVMERLHEFNPDDPSIREFMEHGTFAGQRCQIDLTGPAAVLSH